MKKELFTFSLFCLIFINLASEGEAEDDAEWDKFYNFDGFTPEYPSRLQLNKAVTSFLKHVDTFKFNITILLSEGKVWSNDLPKSFDTFKVTLANKEHLTETDYDKDIAYSFLKLAENEELTANARFVTLKHDPLTADYEHFVTNNDEYVPRNLAYNTLFNVQEGVIGYIPVDAAHWSRYNFYTDTNATTKVFFADVTIELKNSENFSDEELAYAKETVRDYATLVDDDDDIARLIAEKFGKQYPNWTWNVFVGGGKFAVHSEKYALFNVYDTDYAIVAFEQKE